MYTYALIASGQIVNTIVWGGVDILDIPLGDTAARIDGLTPMPAIGWTTPDEGVTWVAPPAPALSPEELALQAFSSFLANGIEITCTSTPSLSGNYPIGDQDQADISAEAQFIAAFGEFTNGQAENLIWAQSNGTNVVWPTTMEFMAFAKASAQLVAAAKVCVISNKPMPSNQVTIP